MLLLESDDKIKKIVRKQKYMYVNHLPTESILLKSVHNAELSDD